jgi:hypothetical protein
MPLLILLFSLPFSCLYDHQDRTPANIYLECLRAFGEKQPGFLETGEIGVKYTGFVPEGAAIGPEKIVLNGKIILIGQASGEKPHIRFWQLRKSHDSPDRHIIDFDARSRGSEYKGSFIMECLNGRMIVSEILYFSAATGCFNQN